MAQMLVTKPFQMLWHFFDVRNKEAKGFIKVAGARGAQAINAAVYTSVAAASIGEIISDCDDRILNGGLKVTSVISTFLTVDAILTAIAMPWFSAIVDGTKRRKSLLKFSHTFWICLVGLQVILLFFVNDTEPIQTTHIFYVFFVSALLISLFYELAITLLFAYLPEITADSTDVAIITGKQYAVVYANQLFLAVTAGSIGLATNLNNVRMAQVASAIAIVVWSVYAIPGFPLLGERDAQEQYTHTGFCGLSPVIQLVKRCATIYPYVTLFLIGHMFYYPAVINVIALATAYLVGELGFGSTDIILVFGSALVASFLGIWIATVIVRYQDSRKAVLITILWWLFLASSAPWLLTGRDSDEVDQTIDERCPNNSTSLAREPADYSYILAIIYGAFYGIGTGMIFTAHTSFFSEIIPGGEEAGMFGLKSFASKVVNWVPPLIFTVINETIDDLQLAFVSISAFFVIGFFFIWAIDYQKARESIKGTLHLRQGKELALAEFEGIDEPMEALPVPPGHDL